MKNVMRFTLIAFGLMLLAACGPTVDQAITYNDAITDEQTLVMDKFDVLFDSYDDYDTPSIMDKAWTDADNATVDAKKKFQEMDAFDGDATFRDAAIDLMDVYKSVLDNEFKKMIEIYKLPEEEYTVEKKEEWEALQEEAIRKMDEGLEKTRIVQDAFASKFGYQIDPNS